MSNNIEEDIKILEEMLKDREEIIKYHAWIGSNALQAIERILADRERLEKENMDLKVYIATAPNLDEMTATKYLNIQKEGYLRGRAEEQQKAKQIINENYISKQVIIGKIAELDKLIKECEEDEEHIGEIPIYIHDKKILEELLEDK